MEVSRRRFLELSLVGSGILAGCTGQQRQSTPADTPSTPTEAPTETLAPTPTEKPTQTATETSTPLSIKPKTYSGNGTKVIQNQQIHSGIVVVEVAYSNLKYDFSGIEIRLQHIESGRTRLLYGDSGSVEKGEGANVVNETGAYHINVESQGDWEITISQPRATRDEAETPPIKTSGTGQTVTGPYFIKGTQILTATNDTEGDFIVTLWPMEGPWSEFEMPLLESGEGEYESSFRFDDLGYLHVNSDGDWTIQIE